MRRRAHGEGSLFQRKDGRWVAAVSLEGGKRKYMYRQAKSEAVLALQHANQAKMQGTLTSTRDERVCQEVCVNRSVSIEIFGHLFLFYMVQMRNTKAWLSPRARCAS